MAKMGDSSHSLCWNDSVCVGSTHIYLQFQEGVNYYCPNLILRYNILQTLCTRCSQHSPRSPWSTDWIRFPCRFLILEESWTSFRGKKKEKRRNWNWVIKDNDDNSKTEAQRWAWERERKERKDTRRDDTMNDHGTYIYDSLLYLVIDCQHLYPFIATTTNTVEMGVRLCLWLWLWCTPPSPCPSRKRGRAGSRSLSGPVLEIWLVEPQPRRVDTDEDICTALTRGIRVLESEDLDVVRGFKCVREWVLFLS